MALLQDHHNIQSSTLRLIYKIRCSKAGFPPWLFILSTESENKLADFESNYSGVNAHDL